MSDLAIQIIFPSFRARDRLSKFEQIAGLVQEPLP